ncbi:uncharacterized protein LOC133662619 [Entelurus aequoreus]|uniref:uncharacterized protein LOC133662619 n=1 Tax=Entelurus aequoreus TaxID=161455 RepID=UPI002B1D5CC7|nr:uncharacterized protein LOC133662619 [Entelurus aequoreus]
MPLLFLSHSVHHTFNVVRECTKQTSAVNQTAGRRHHSRGKVERGRREGKKEEVTSSSSSPWRRRDSEEEMFSRESSMFLLFIRASLLTLLLLLFLPLARCVALTTSPRRLACGQEVPNALLRNLWTQSRLLIQRLPEERRRSKSWRLLPNFCTGCPQCVIGWLEVRQMIDIYQHRVFNTDLISRLLPLHYLDLLDRLQHTLMHCVPPGPPSKWMSAIKNVDKQLQRVSFALADNLLLRSRMLMLMCMFHGINELTGIKLKARGPDLKIRLRLGPREKTTHSHSTHPSYMSQTSKTTKDIKDIKRAELMQPATSTRKRRKEGVMKAVTEFTFILTWINELMHRVHPSSSSSSCQLFQNPEKSSLVFSQNLQAAMSPQRLCLLILMGTMGVFANHTGQHPDIRRTLESISDVLELRKKDIAGAPPFMGIIRTINTCQSHEVLQLLNATLSMYGRIFNSILERSPSLLDQAPLARRAQLKQDLMKLQGKTRVLRAHLQHCTAPGAREALDTLKTLKVDDIKVQKAALAQFLEVYNTATLIRSRSLTTPTEVPPLP